MRWRPTKLVHPPLKKKKFRGAAGPVKGDNDVASLFLSVLVNQADPCLSAVHLCLTPLGVVKLQVRILVWFRRGRPESSSETLGLKRTELLPSSSSSSAVVSTHGVCSQAF